MKNFLLTIILMTTPFIFAQTTHTVNGGMSGGAYYFTPENLSIEQGDIVVWINDGGCHDVNGDINTITNQPFNNPETFDSPTTCESGAEIFTYTFNVTGTYNYDCSVGSHAVNGMVGTVTVNAPASITVVDIIVNSDNHTTLEAAVIAAELDDDLSADGPFTVFAPTDQAFEALPEGTVASLLEDPAGDLANILLHHVASGSVLSTDLSDGMMVTTLNGTDITVTLTDDGVMINNAMVTAADILADNGVVHVIDAVLIPEEDETNTVVDIIVNSENHTTLETAVGAAGLGDYLSTDGPFTVFAPTDAAFAALPDGILDDLLADPTGQLADVLKYHVASGSVLSTDLSDGMIVTTLNGTDITITINDDGVMINNAMVTVADILADNGVVHVIDAVLIPVEDETTTVVDIIVNSDNHTTLEAAVIAAGLAEDLSDLDENFTVFAPTDEAFLALPDGALDDLLLDPTGLLSNILLHHVASGSVLSTDLTDGMIVTTLNGTEITVTFTDDGVMIDNAMVTQADIIADNGVVHVINAVLVPEDDCEDEDDIVEEYFGSFFITTCSGLIDYLDANYGYSLSTACNWNGMPMTSFDGEIVSDFCDCTCSDIDNTSISEIIQDNTNYLYSIDITGRKIEKMTLNAVVFDVYESGLVIKRIQK